MTTRPLRLLHFIDVRNIGGVERMFADFLTYSPARPVQHITVADHSAIAPAIRDTILRHSHVESIRRFMGLTLPRRPRFFRHKNRERLSRQLRPDLVMVWNQFIDYRHLAPGARAFSCPVLYYEHGGAWYRHNEEVVRAFFSQVDGIIAVSEAARRMLQLKYQVTHPIQVRLNTLRRGIVSAETAPRVLPQGRPVRLGCAGRLAPVKCMGLVVLTVKALCDRGVAAEAVIVGKGREKSALDALIAQHGLQSRVRFAGLLDGMDDFYQNIDFYIGASMHESFGLTCIEASAWGVPVITSNMDGMAEAVIHDRTGLCLTPTLDKEAYLALTHASPDIFSLVYWPQTDNIAPPRMLDPEKIADAVMTLLHDPDRYHRLSAQAMAHVAACGSFDALCKDLYQSIESYLTPSV